MKHAFDHIAVDYDDGFTNSIIGKAQRSLVWNYLQPFLENKNDIKVLELNCGTGEDAKWMAQFGANILATDVSINMVQITNAKVEAHNLKQQVVCKQMDVNKIDAIVGIEKFDIIFSNFGGLNCIEPKKLDSLLQYELPSLLSKNGKMIFVVMPTFCLWESFYHAITLKRKNIFRRFSSKPLMASLSKDVTIKTWYYSPRWMKNHAASNMQVKLVKPIGFFIPPSYLNNFFTKRMSTFKLLQRMEKWITNRQLLATASDHYLIHLQKIEG